MTAEDQKPDDQLAASSDPSESFQAEGGDKKKKDKGKKKEEKEAPPADEPRARVYYADWIRFMAILLVIFVHCLVNSFDASGLDPDVELTIQHKKDGIIKSLVQIGIPMFFYISGISATFFNTEKRGFVINYIMFVGGKALRLLVPFIVAIFVFLIPRLYFGQPYESWCRPDGEHMENEYGEFLVKTLPDIHMKLSWLWYLPALFIDFMLTYPLLRWTIRRSRGHSFECLTDGGLIVLQLATLACWLWACMGIVTKDDFGEIYLVPAVVALTGVIFLFYLFQLLIQAADVFAIFIKFVGPLGSVLLNLWKVQAKEQQIYHLFLMICYDAIFFSQGVVDMCYYGKMLRSRSKWGQSSWAPLSVGLAIFLYALSTPMNYSNMGFLFFYPLYQDHALMSLHTSGSWLWIYGITWFMAEFGNDKFNDVVYDFISGASLYAYVSHYFFILILSVLIIRPNQIGFIPGFFIMFFGTFILVLATYIPLNLLYECVFPPKETKKMELVAEPDQDDGAGKKKKKAGKKGGKNAQKEGGDIEADSDYKKQ